MVEVETQGRDILLHRSEIARWADVKAAAAEMMADGGYTPDGLTIAELRDEERR